MTLSPVRVLMSVWILRTRTRGCLGRLAKEFAPVLDESNPEWLDEVAAPVRVFFELGGPLLGGRQHAPEADEGHLLDQERPHLVRPPARVLALEPDDDAADLGFKLAFGVHRELLSAPASSGGRDSPFAPSSAKVPWGQTESEHSAADEPRPLSMTGGLSTKLHQLLDWW